MMIERITKQRVIALAPFFSKCVGIPGHMVGLNKQFNYYQLCVYEDRLNSEKTSTYKSEYAVLAKGSLQEIYDYMHSAIDLHEIKARLNSDKIYTVKNVENIPGKAVFVTTDILAAIRYILKFSNSDGWYDLEVEIKGQYIYPDIHVWTLIDSYLIKLAYEVNWGAVSDVMSEVNYNLNGNTIHYCEDYEQAYEIAQLLVTTDEYGQLKDLKHIIVN